MAIKVFVTGVTGFIGGDGFYALHQAHPDWEFRVLVRDEAKAKQVTQAHPDVTPVIGTLDDAAILEEEAKKTDIVLHTADSSDHEVAARAISKGLLEGHSASNPAAYIHISGTGILCWYDMDHKRYGEPPLPDQSYEDLDRVDGLLNLPDQAFHRDIDKIILETAAAKPDAVKVAILCPPTIYGEGRGPVNTRSRQTPGLVAATLREGYGPKIGTGKAEWDNVHVHDLSNLSVLLADAYAAGKPHAHEGEIWGPRAYFLVENGEHVWGDLAELVANVAAEKGYIAAAETKQLSAERALEVDGFQALSWGLNSKGRANRAKKFLGWKPTGQTIQETIPALVESEAKRLGLSKKN